MPSTVMGQYAITLPADTTANRPTASTAMVRMNTTTSCIEYYNGSAWIAVNFPGSSAQRPASSAVQIFNAGVRGKGYFWLTSPNGGIVQNFCDLDTVDEDGVAGWILVAQFPSYDWRNSGWSTRSALNPNGVAVNGSAQDDLYSRQWSANWGDYSMNKFRVHFSTDVNTTGSNAPADWYFHWSTAIAWKQVWSPAAGFYNYMNDTSGDNTMNINASYHSGWPAPVNAGNARPRCCLRGFNWAYNLKFGYQVAQRWSNLSDGSGEGTSQNTSHNFWAGLTSPGYPLGWDVNGDGSVAILPQGSSSNTAGQDCYEGNAKFGYDDSAGALLWSSTATNNFNTHTGTTDYNRPLFFWIK